MPAIVALPAFWGAITAGTAATAGIYAANKQSGAAEDAANLTTAASNHSADLQSQATADALAFSKQSAENAFQNSEAARQGNYGQYAAQEQRLGSVGDLIGAPARQIPAYVPGVDPNYAGAAPASGAPATSATGNPADPSAITAQLTANYKSLGVAPTGRGTGPTDLAYYADQIAATGGLTPQNTAFWFGPSGRIAQDLSKAKGGAPAAPTAPTSVGASLAPPVTPFSTVPIAPALTMPTAGSYLSGNR